MMPVKLIRRRQPLRQRSILCLYLRPGLLCALLLTLNSCYVLQQAGPFLSQRLKDKPIDKLIAAETIDPATRTFLEEVLQIKAFASTTLGLNEDRNFTTYLEVENDYVATVVSACPPFSFETWMWNYPLVGKMPYKGFYNEKQALREVEKLKKRQLDVYIRRVEAFSSLGYFTDPLFSYMQNYSPYDLAELIIHEQTHATLFFKGQSQFNEELASFVGDTGARLYVRTYYGLDSPAYREIDPRKHDAEVFRTFIADLKESLIGIYSHTELGEAELGRRKAARIALSQQQLLDEYDTLFQTQNYKGYAQMEVNNAYLSLFSIYYEDLSLYRGLYTLCGENLTVMFGKLRPLKKEKDPRAVIRSWLEEQL